MSLKSVGEVLKQSEYSRLLSTEEWSARKRRFERHQHSYTDAEEE
jgi:hypothetical protein